MWCWRGLGLIYRGMKKWVIQCAPRITQKNKRTAIFFAGARSFIAIYQLFIREMRYSGSSA